MKTPEVCSAITLSGIDGVGKTTCARALVSKLEKSKLRVRYVWFRWGHIVSLPVLAIARILGLATERKAGDWRASRYDLRKAPRLSKLLVWTTYLDFVLLSYVRFTRARLTGTILVLDRYFPDAIVDIAMATGAHGILEAKYVQRYISLVPENTMMVLIQAPRAIVLSRRPELAQNGELEMRTQLYEALAGLIPMRVVENDGSVQDLVSNLTSGLRFQIDWGKGTTDRTETGIMD